MISDETTNTRPLFYIRDFQIEDAKACANIWEKGLDQTWKQYWCLQKFWRRFMERLAQEALAPNGDVGPDGKNLHKIWMKNDRKMIVAVTKSDDIQEHDTVIGCVAVKRGCDETTDALVTDHRFAIFRWSVDEHWRGLGVGKALVIAAEEFARQNTGTELWATTANPISSLSLKKMGFVSTYSFFGYSHLCKKLN